jgi:hypothetical protein
VGGSLLSGARGAGRVRTLRRQCGVALAGALAIAAVLPATALGTGGGEEMESMAKQPARVLAQQAIAILRVLDDPEQALDRLDAAVESKDQEDVDTALLREADEALEAGDSDRTVSLLPLGAARRDHRQGAPRVGPRVHPREGGPGGRRDRGRRRRPAARGRAAAPPATARRLIPLR